MKLLVILASYNGEKYIKEQILSILNQSEVDLDIFIYDDQSKDKTTDVIRNIHDNRIHLHVNQKNSGSSALNFLNSLCTLDDLIFQKYQFISFADQDDIWENKKLITAMKILEIENSSLYASNMTLWDTKKKIKTLLRKDYTQTDFDYLFEGASAGCTYVFKSTFAIEFVKKIKNINLTNWKYLSHDWLLYFYARISNNSVFIDSNSYINYRIHDTNVHGSLNLISIKSFGNKIKLFYNGWYFIQSKNFQNHFLLKDSIQFKIYYFYNKNWIYRLYILTKYNFKLIRSKRKFFQFYFFNIFYIN